MTFQAESKKSGDHFEDVVMSELQGIYQRIQKNVYLPDVGVEVDFVADGYYIEAKGGYDGDKKRPGAKRTDSVKKAIANGSLIKAVFPDNRYIVYFSSKPVPESSSDIMIRVALEYGIIDEVIYLENKSQMELFEKEAGNDQWQ